MSLRQIAAVRLLGTGGRLATSWMSRMGAALFGLGLLAAPAAWADTWIVMTNGEIGANDALDKNTCTPTGTPHVNQCPTLREAITATASGDWIVFDPSLDGKTITLKRYTNCLASAQAKGPTCLPLNAWPSIPSSSPATPYVSQFGASAFFISGKAITINATQTPDLTASMAHGVVIARDPGAPAFRLFDIDGTTDNSGNATSVLYLYGITLSGGLAQGGDGASSTAGGALGAGGAIFNRGELHVNQSAFVGNAANGGSQGAMGSSSGGGGVGQSSDGSGIGTGGGPNGGSLAAGNGGFGGGGGAVLGGGIGGFGGGGASGYGGGFGGGAGNGGNGGFGGGNGGTTSAGGGGGAGMGGAIFNDGGTVTLYESTLSANAATGGANHAGNGRGGSAYGGAIFNYNGILKVNDVTLVGNGVTAGTSNTAGFGGNIAAGAIYSLGNSQTGCYAGGNVSCTTSGATLTMNNSIAAKNLNASNDVVVNLINAGTSTASGVGNFIGGLSGTLSVSQVNAVAVIDPQLGALPVPLTGGMTDALVPQPGSPVIDAVSCANASFMDQRGVARPQSAVPEPTTPCDIGAVEVRRNVTLSVIVTGTGAVNAVTPPMPASGGIVNCTSAGGPNCMAVYPNSEAQPFTSRITVNLPQGRHWDMASAGGCSLDGNLDASSIITSVLLHRCGFSVNLVPNTTATVVTSSVTPSIVGDPVTFTAAVSPTSPSTALPSGTVTFSDGATAICTNAALVGTGPSTAQATCTVSNLALGSHSISAQYHGDGNYPAANQPESAVFTQQVVKPTLTITANDLTKTYGQTLLFAGTEFTASGLRNGDTVTSVTLASAGANASASVAGSPYTIVVPNITGGTYNPANYNIVLVTGKLTVLPAAQALNFAAPTMIAVGMTLPFSVAGVAPNAGNPIVPTSVTPGVCTVAMTSSTATGAAGTVTALNQGTCLLQADQAPDPAGNYAAGRAQASIQVNVVSPAPSLSGWMQILLAATLAGVGGLGVRLRFRSATVR